MLLAMTFKSSKSTTYRFECSGRPTPKSFVAAVAAADASYVRRTIRDPRCDRIDLSLSSPPCHPVHVAASHSSANILQLLLLDYQKRKCRPSPFSPDGVDAAGNTPMHCVVASASPSVTVLRVLIDAGADLKKMNLAGQTPTDLALERHRREFAKRGRSNRDVLIKLRECVKFLLNLKTSAEKKKLVTVPDSKAQVLRTKTNRIPIRWPPLLPSERPWPRNEESSQGTGTGSGTFGRDGDDDSHVRRQLLKNRLWFHTWKKSPENGMVKDCSKDRVPLNWQ